LLSDDINACKELLEIEPNSKWALLTITLLLKEVEGFTARSQLFANINKLRDMDSHHALYYDDLRTKYCLEFVIDENRSAIQQNAITSINISSQKLSCLQVDSVAQLGAMGIRELNLQNNLLCSIVDLWPLFFFKKFKY